MEMILKGDLFLNQTEKAIFLFENGISTVIENNELKCTNIKDYMNSLLLLYSNQYINKEECNEGLKDIYKTVYKRKLSKQIENEKYNFCSSDNNAKIFCDGKYLLIKKVKNEEECFSHYYIEAEDHNIDKEPLDFREIPFLIKRNSPIYGNLNQFYQYCKDNRILSANNDINSNHIRIDQDEDLNYRLVIVKNKQDRLLSDDRKTVIDVGTPFTNDKYLTIDFLFETISREKRNDLLRGKNYVKTFK